MAKKTEKETIETDEAPEKEKKPKKVSKKKEQPVPLPIMLETAFTLSKVGVLVVGALIFALAILNGDGPLVASLRSGISVLSLGLMAWVVDWFLAHYALEALKPELEKSPEISKIESIIEKQA